MLLEHKALKKFLQPGGHVELVDGKMLDTAKRETFEETGLKDLVFYNYVLKCFVLIDLKLDKLTHQDIGQMDFYVRYFDNEIKEKEDNPTIGIILCSDKKDTIVKYSVLNDNKNLFASKYQLYLPTEKELALEIEKQKAEFNDNN